MSITPKIQTLIDEEVKHMSDGPGKYDGEFTYRCEQIGKLLVEQFLQEKYEKELVDRITNEELKDDLKS